MRTLTNVAAMQRLARTWRRTGVRVGFVPTMGYLHDGHLSLMRRARQAVGKEGVVVVSIFVNPLQFAPGEDFARYPRDLARDQKLCRDGGVDFIFAPGDSQMYPGGKPDYGTYVVEERLSSLLEGASRPGHFRGVTTIVAKLFNIVLPDVAVFGAKDFQQAAIIQQMVRDLNFPLKMIIAPTVRELDGLAMSSRNKYLEGELRLQAAVLWRAIQTAQTVVRESRQPVQALALRKKLRDLIEGQPAARVDYIEFFDPATLEPSAQVERGTRLAMAVFIGKTRLIDNASL